MTRLYRARKRCKWRKNREKTRKVAFSSRKLRKLTLQTKKLPNKKPLKVKDQEGISVIDSYVCAKILSEKLHRKLLLDNAFELDELHHITDLVGNKTYQEKLLHKA